MGVRTDAQAPYSTVAHPQAKKISPTEGRPAGPIQGGNASSRTPHMQGGDTYSTPGGPQAKNYSCRKVFSRLSGKPSGAM